MVSVVVPQNQIDIAGKPQAFRRGLEAGVILRLGGEWTGKTITVAPQASFGSLSSGGLY